MSNCIEIRNNAVRFTDQEMDLPKLLADLETAENSPAKRNPEQDPNLTELLGGLWWYVVDAYDVEFHDKHGVDPKAVTILFGEGRSIHTWRDLNWLIAYALQPYMKTRKEETMLIHDTGEGGNRFYEEKVVFSPDSEEAGIISWSTALKESIARQNLSTEQPTRKAIRH